MKKYIHKHTGAVLTIKGTKYHIRDNEGGIGSGTVTASVRDGIKAYWTPMYDFKDYVTKLK